MLNAKFSLRVSILVPILLLSLQQTSGDFVCNEPSATSTKKFIDKGCPRVESAQCVQMYAECTGKKGLQLQSALAKCSPFFSYTNISDFQNLICHVCENTKSLFHGEDGFNILCCIDTYELEGTTITPLQRDDISDTCSSGLDPAQCKATLFRKLHCAIKPFTEFIKNAVPFIG